MADVKVKFTTQADNKGVDSTKSAFKDFKKAAGELSQDLFGVNLASVSVGAGLAAAGKFIVDSTRETVRYAEAVRDLSRNLNISSEEASKLIQIGDDYKVSTEEMTAALQMAVRNGFVPSIENLSKLAEVYAQYTDPVQRANVLTEIFGRNWTTLTPILEAGSDAINQAAQSAEDLGLVLSQEDLDAARKLEIELDNLNDQWTALKTVVGNFVVPILSDAAQALNTISTASKKIDSALDEHADAVLRTSNSYDEYIGELYRARLAIAGVDAETAAAIYTRVKETIGINNLAKSLGYLSEEQYKYLQQGYALQDFEAGFVEVVEDSTQALDEQVEVTKEMIAAAESAANEFGDFARSYDQYYDEMESHNATLKELYAQLAEAKGSEKDSILEAIEAEKAAIADLEKEHHDKIGWMIADIVLMETVRDGVFSDEDMAAYAAFLEEWGLITHEEAMKMIADWEAVRLAMERATANTAPSNQPTPERQGYGGVGGGGGTTGGDGRQRGWGTGGFAKGGQLGKGWAMVGEEGWELVDPGGRVFPHSESERMIKHLGNMNHFATGSLGGITPWSQSIPNSPTDPNTGNISGTEPYYPANTGYGTPSDPNYGNLTGGVSSMSIVGAMASATTYAASSIKSSSERMSYSSEHSAAEMSRNREVSEQMLEEMRGLRTDMRESYTYIVSEFKKMTS